MLNLLLDMSGLNRWEGSACYSPTLHPQPGVGRVWGEKADKSRVGRSALAFPHPTLYKYTQTYTQKLTFPTSVSFYFSFLPILFLSLSPSLSFLPLSLLLSPLPSPLFFLTLSFIFLGLFLFLLSFSLPFPSFFLSLPSSCCLLYLLWCLSL